MEDPNETLVLLRRWHAGDGQALADLVLRDETWIRSVVRRRLGPLLRPHVESDDVLQEAMLQALRSGPRFLLADREQFRALLARMVENILRMKLRGMQRQRRDVRREQRLHEEHAPLDLTASATSPSQAAARSEHAGWLQLGMELLDEEDREVIRLRQYEGWEFTAIGAELGIQPDAARMRFQRALGRLGQVVQRVRAQGLATLLGRRT